MQGICFASLPTDVLHSFCRVLQLGAYTTKAMRAYAEILRIYGPDFPEDLLPPRPTVEAVPLRLCCKELAVAYDFVRPCIRFPMEDMDAVGSYLQKLPNLVTVAIDCDKQSSCASKCLSDLYGILPELQRLAVRWGSVTEAFTTYSHIMNHTPWCVGQLTHRVCSTLGTV